MRKFLLLPAVFLFILAFAVPSYAVTVDEVAEMAKSGISDDVILALLDATGSAFKLSPEDVLMLKDAGVSDAVILKMIGEKGKAEVEKPAGDIYLQLTDEQFKNLYLPENYQPPQEIMEEPQTVRQPQYYQSPPMNYNQGYISRPNYNQPSYSSGPTRTTYNYDYPGSYQYDRKVYRPVYYNGWPSYYIFNGTVYYPRPYGNYYGPYPHSYPLYSEIHSPPYYYHNYSHSRSYGKFKYYKDDDWYFSLGFHF